MRMERPDFARTDRPLITIENLGLTLGSRSRSPSRWGKSAEISWPGTILFQGIQGQIYPGDRWAILGASGAGKTSLLRLLNRLVDPSQGQLRWRDQPYSEVSIGQLRQQVLWIPQEPKLLGMTVAQTLEYPLKLRQLKPSTIADRMQLWIDRMDIPGDWLERTEQQLSGGQRQWVALTRGLLAEPSVLLLDEPTASLNPQRAAQLQRVLKTQVEQTGLTIAVTSHHTDWVKHLCDRVLYLGDRQGQVFQSPIDWSGLEHQLAQTRQQEAEAWDDDRSSPA